MRQVLLVGLGGGLGAIARYKLGAWVFGFAHESRFPLGTFLVNIIGCLAAGILMGLFLRYEAAPIDVGPMRVLSPDARLFLFAGVLGGFTTFSAFGVETVSLLRRGDVGLAGVYVGLSVVVGLTLLWIGLVVAKG